MIAFCRRLAIDFAAILVGWTSLDLVEDWLFGHPIAAGGWLRYVLPTIAAALTASIGRALRERRPPQPAMPTTGTRLQALLAVDWADLLSLLVAYEAAVRLPRLMSWPQAAGLRLTLATILAVAL